MWRMEQVLCRVPRGVDEEKKRNLEGRRLVSGELISLWRNDWRVAKWIGKYVRDSGSMEMKEKVECEQGRKLKIWKYV